MHAGDIADALASSDRWPASVQRLDYAGFGFEESPEGLTDVIAASLTYNCVYDRGDLRAAS